MSSGCIYYSWQTVCAVQLFATCGVFVICFIGGNTLTHDDEHVVNFNCSGHQFHNSNLTPYLRVRTTEK